MRWIPAGIEGIELGSFASLEMCILEIVFLLTDFEPFLRDRCDYPCLVAFEISLVSF